MKFLQLDIEDKFLDTEPPINGSTGLGLLGPQNGHAPFTQADNPVMSVVSFMASLADPQVTAAAAGKSVEAMKKSLRQKLDKDSGAEAGEKEDDGAMDVDTITAAHQTTTTTTTTQSTFVTASLAGTAARAGALASHEEREMTRLVSAVVNTTLQKLELKLQQFNEMEALIQAERRELERGRQQLFLDRLSFKRRVRDVQEGLRMAAETGNQQAAMEVLDGSKEKLGFVQQGQEGVQPLSAEGAAKTHVI